MRRIPRLARDTRANVTTLFALFLPVMISCLALGVDYGSLTVQQRKLQKTADLAAIVAASDIDEAEQAVARFLALNGQDIAVRTDRGLLLDDRLVAPQDHRLQEHRGIASLVRGRYFPDPSIDSDRRFVVTDVRPDAARVTIARTGSLYFSSILADPPRLSAAGTAATEKLAGFSVGSRLARLDGGLANALLGAMLGTEISLKAMDYEALLDADVSLLALSRSLATRLDLTAVTYDEILDAELTPPQLLSAIRTAGGVAAATQSALRLLEAATSKSSDRFRLRRIVNLDAGRALSVRERAPFDMQLGVLDLVTASAALANGDRQIAVDTGIRLPGIGRITLALAIGEPPVGTPPHALAPVGTAVRTAQTRLRLDVEIDGLQLLAGSRIHLPIYVEVAHAEARLSDIQCSPGSTTSGSVAVDAVPGVVELAIGNVDPAALSSFSSTPRVTRATLVDAAGLVRISGKAHVETKNLKAARLTFSASDIARRRVKSVSTRDLLGSSIATLLGNLDLEVKALSLSLGLEPLLRNSLVATLSRTAGSLDALLSNVLLLAGVRIGEADVRVTGISCDRPVLVQ